MSFPLHFLAALVVHKLNKVLYELSTPLAVMQ